MTLSELHAAAKPYLPFVAAAGFFCLAIYHFATGDHSLATRNLCLALGFLGIHATPGSPSPMPPAAAPAAVATPAIASRPEVIVTPHIFDPHAAD